MNKKNILVTATSVAIFLATASAANANAVPDFGSCLNPQWGKTQENVGSNHGVVGLGSFAGVDSIYRNGGNVLQCLCTNDGRGYQTNWLKADNMSEGQKSSLKSQGWMYVPYGKDWGLDDAPYMAKNVEYTCANCTPTPTPSVGTTPTPTPTVTSGPTATPTPTTESKVGGALAATGNAGIIYASILAGAAALIAGMVLRRFSK